MLSGLIKGDSALAKCFDRCRMQAQEHCVVERDGSNPREAGSTQPTSIGSKLDLEWQMPREKLSPT